MACGILVPWPGIEPIVLAVKVRSLNHWTDKEILSTELLTLRKNLGGHSVLQGGLGGWQCELKISPPILISLWISKKCHSHWRVLASRGEWGLPKLWSSRYCPPPAWLMRSWRWGWWQSSHLPPLPLLEANKETGFDPIELRCLWNEWIQGA